MDPQRRIILIAASACCLIVLLTLSSALPVKAAPNNGYAIAWWTIDGGGAMFSTGGAYSLGGTMGQADAADVLSGGTYTLSGGFWFGGGSAALYLPLILR